ncbi:uncharacterized protein LOC126679945 isoform X2 [Mercurialis annua]|uniref:uncharacterized protein LOC126679945 isoform X2 n=1 Tax=Mercurialis annua TaxID=3986 RepID=UPI00216094F7|nr:uncharacterized protein LOC126679945 isoform X2 [Mercurialis annua]
MSLSLKVTSSCSANLPFHHLGFNKLRYYTSISSFPGKHVYFQKCHISSLNEYHRRRLFSINGENNLSQPYPNDINSDIEEEESEAGQKLLTSSEILKKLKRYGLSGVLSYGILNTVYYLTTFLLVWFYVAPAPGKMGYFAAVKRFLKVMAMVWAGSQVTKLFRAGGALALAPFVDTGLSWFSVKYKFESQGKAFMAAVGFCFGLAFILFLVVTLLWA